MGTHDRSGRDRIGRQARGRRSSVAALGVLLVVAGLTAASPAGAQTPPAGPATEAAAPEASARWLQVDAGYYHACGITFANRLYCWGYGETNALGTGGPVNWSAPAEVAGGDTDWAQVSAGYDQTCAVKTDHRLFCWGRDTHGQLGNGPGQQDAGTPVEVAGATNDWAQVSAGSATCAVKTDHRLYCWGQDYRGMLGNGGDDLDAESPTEVTFVGVDWQTVDVGSAHTCALTTLNQIRCFGDNSYGQTGDGGPATLRQTPVAVAGDPLTWSSLAVSGNHTCATKSTGRLFCWGLNEDLQLGTPNPGAFTRTTPTQVVGRRTDWVSVSGGGFGHTCATRTSGRLFCWGQTWRGALGQALPAADQATPLQVPGTITDWATATGGLASTCALRLNGLLYCFGNNQFGQAGINSTNKKVLSPTRVALST